VKNGSQGMEYPDNAKKPHHWKRSYPSLFPLKLMAVCWDQTAPARKLTSQLLLETKETPPLQSIVDRPHSLRGRKGSSAYYYPAPKHNLLPLNFLITSYVGMPRKEFYCDALA